MKKTNVFLACALLCAAVLVSCSDSGTSAKGFDMSDICWDVGLPSNCGLPDSSSNFDAGAVCPESGRGTFVDERDGQEYKYTTIGNQVWMAQNLNYKTYYSMFHEKEYKDCAECGRWYNLEINLPNRDVMDSVCPAGWKVPTIEDWNILFTTIGNVSTALRVLLSESWEFVQSTNACGFNGIEASAIRKNKDEFVFLNGSAGWCTQTVISPENVLKVFFGQEARTRKVMELK